MIEKGNLSDLGDPDSWSRQTVQTLPQLLSSFVIDIKKFIPKRRPKFSGLQSDLVDQEKDSKNILGESN